MSRKSEKRDRAKQPPGTCDLYQRPLPPDGRCDSEPCAELRAIRERNATAWRAIQERRAAAIRPIQKRYAAALRPFLDKRGRVRPPKRGSEKHRRFTEVERLHREEMDAAERPLREEMDAVERLHHEEMDAWQGKHGAQEREPGTPAELRAWIEQRRDIAERAAAAHGAGAAALDRDLAALYEKAHGRAVEMRGQDPVPAPDPAGRSALDLQRLCEWCTTANQAVETPPAPKDLVSTAVAAYDHHVSRSTLKRYRNEGRLKGHRRDGAPRNSPFSYSRRDLEALFPRCKKPPEQAR